ncbi:iron-containing alcohol dehydrogenase [uncultured Enterovirga sp.]|uniref:iron-containing alcohol dehydrogenase n=1 Tax=uncultured Enterovirga sp. TaxID=2026352 RepID=UPI0035C9AD87
MNLRGNWSYPTAIRFGAGRIAELPEACRSLGMTRPLLVTDAGLAKLPMVAAAIESCRAAGLECGLFGGIRPNPVGSDIEAGVAAYRTGRHDGVVAFGGGSGLDAAKAVALMVGQTRPMFDFEDREAWSDRVDTSGMAPVVAVPTTSGTGSEVGRASVITDESDHTKKIIFHPKMMPAIVIADPELTLGLPPKITAAVGMDALSHSLESFCSPLYHPIAQGVALESIRLVKDWLPVAVRDGSDIAARSHMMAASSMGAIAFQKGLGAMHSLAHPCGAIFDTHHGMTIAVVMPYVLAFNRPAIEDRMAALARYLDLLNPSFQAVLDWVLQLRAEIGIPASLDALGIGLDTVARLAPMAARDPSCGGNPRPLDEATLAGLYENAITGRLQVS